MLVMALDKPGTLGELIKTSRTKLGMTQRDVLAQLSNHGYDYTEATLSNWENDNPKARPPVHDPEFVKAMANVLQIDQVEILEILGYNIRGMFKNPPTKLPDWLAKWVENATPKQLKRMRLLLELMSEEDDE